MLNVGIIGFGGMGNMHLGIYNRLKGVEVVAVGDIDKKKLKTGASELKINIGTGSGSLDPEKTRLYENPDDIMKDDDVDIVDVCTPTFLHADYAVKALKAGKHVFCEKPMSLTYKDCQRMVRAAKAAGKTLTIGQCIRFWPEYVYLADTIAKGRLGKLRSLELVRQTPPPLWSWKNWFAKAEWSGGGLLDLHVHDIDFLVSVFGKPKSVKSQGSVGFSRSIDGVATLYDYEPGIIVSAAGHMSLPQGAPFKMAYLATFEKGMIDYDVNREPSLNEYRNGKEYHPKVKKGDGYFHELSYFLKCVKAGKPNDKCLPESCAVSIKVAEAERKSCQTWKPVRIS